MDKFYAYQQHKINDKFIEVKKKNINIINNNNNNNKNIKKIKISKNTSWDNFMKFESFWVL